VLITKKTIKLCTHAREESLTILCSHLDIHGLTTILATTSGLLSIEVVLASATRDNLAVLGDAETLRV